MNRIKSFYHKTHRPYTAVAGSDFQAVPMDVERGRLGSWQQMQASTVRLADADYLAAHFDTSLTEHVECTVRIWPSVRRRPRAGTQTESQ